MSPAGLSIRSMALASQSEGMRPPPIPRLGRLRFTSTPPNSAAPLTTSAGAPGSPGPSAFWSNPPKMPIPSTWTVRPSGTVISTPPNTARALISLVAPANVAVVRSSSTPPNIANVVSCSGTTHSPLRVAPPKMATTEEDPGVDPGGLCHDRSTVPPGAVAGVIAPIPTRGASAAAEVAGGRPSRTGTRSATVRAAIVVESRSSYSSRVSRPSANASPITSANRARSASEIRIRAAAPNGPSAPLPGGTSGTLTRPAPRRRPRRARAHA